MVVQVMAQVLDQGGVGRGGVTQGGILGEQFVERTGDGVFRILHSDAP
jgi:hypothetical protein